LKNKGEGEKMAKYLKAQEFYNYFLQKLAEDGEDALEKYKDNREWTEYLTETFKYILKDKYEYKAIREYLRVDMIGWSCGNSDWGDKGWTNSKNNTLGINEHCWDLEIAIEYENDPKDWMDEVIKLCHIKCGLKVVIGYSDRKKRTLDIEKLKLAAKHMNNLKFGKPDSSEEFLVILGNAGFSKDEEDISFDFRPYVFNNDGFNPLNDD
jgi:hypothetical protein